MLNDWGESTHAPWGKQFDQHSKDHKQVHLHGHTPQMLQYIDELWTDLIRTDFHMITHDSTAPKAHKIVQQDNGQGHGLMTV